MNWIMMSLRTMYLLFIVSSSLSLCGMCDSDSDDDRWNTVDFSYIVEPCSDQHFKEKFDRKFSMYQRNLQSNQSRQVDYRQACAWASSIFAEMKIDKKVHLALWNSMLFRSVIDFKNISFPQSVNSTQQKK